MTITRKSKPDRQRQLQNDLQKNPFYTDEELAQRYGVSVQTIRLDRVEMGIPELRKRIKEMAESSYDQVRSLSISEVIGEVVDLTLNERAISLFSVEEEHVFAKTKICRGHHIFAQANSLAVAVVDAEVALTASASIRFKRPVRLGERLIAKAVVEDISGNQYKVRVETRVKEDTVFSATFRIFKVNEDMEREEYS